MIRARTFLCLSRRVSVLFAVVGLVLLGLTGWLIEAESPASAHTGGKAIPKIRIESVPENPQGGLAHEITVTIHDADSGAPVSGAQVTAEAEMTVPHTMRTLPIELAEGGTPGVYKGRLRYPMPAEWTLQVTVDGPSVQKATAELPVSVKLTVAPSSDSLSSSPESNPAGARPSVVVSGRLSMSDFLPLASLVFHSVFAVVWVACTILLVLVANSKTSRWFSQEARFKVLAKGSPIRRAALASGILLVATGIANGLYAAPFRLVPTLSSIRTAMGYPFGSLYLLVLAGKIVTMGALVSINRIPGIQSANSLDSNEANTMLHSTARLALAADTVLLPLLLVLVTLLRYVHVLVHVSLAVQ